MWLFDVFVFSHSPLSVPHILPFSLTLQLKKFPEGRNVTRKVWGTKYSRRCFCRLMKMSLRAQKTSNISENSHRCQLLLSHATKSYFSYLVHQHISADFSFLPISLSPQFLHRTSDLKLWSEKSGDYKFIYLL